MTPEAVAQKNIQQASFAFRKRIQVELFIQNKNEKNCVSGLLKHRLMMEKRFWIIVWGLVQQV
jgi:hypothetical protein